MLADGFLDTDGILARLPVCRRTLQDWREHGKIPYIQLGDRRVIYHWDSVKNALLRQQKNV